MRRPPRLPASNYLGGRQYFLTICTSARQPIFRDPVVVDLTWLQFQQSADDQSCEVTAYCFMPDHIHALITGVHPSADFVRFVDGAKQRSGYWFAQARHERLWQESYFDRVLRREETGADVIAYIVNNPVRAGLVERVERYPFWGSSVYSREALLEMIAVRRG